MNMWRKMFGLHGVVSRGRYALFGVVLFFIKHNLDRLLAAFVFKREWTLTSYWKPSNIFSLPALPDAEVPFYGAMLAVALVFIWLGVVLTLQRLRDAGLPLWLVVFFFAPVVNLFLFLLLCLLPSASAQSETVKQPNNWRRSLGKFVPTNQVGSAGVGIAITLLLSLAATQFSVIALENYGWGLFVGVPFFIGLVSVLVYGYHAERTVGACLLVSLIAISLFGAMLVLFAVEGVICIVMAAPIGFVLAVFGGVIGYAIQKRIATVSHNAPTLRVCAAMFALVPLLMYAEKLEQTAPRVLPVKTSVVINATPARVWRHVVSFSELPAPTEMLFKLGYAYPLRAEIEGRGVGAIRHCVFSTGAFVEPIEVWDEPRLLKFSVTAQPPAMRELSPYASIKTPHLDDYLLSRGGQFKLTELADGRTLLEGTTWYEVKIYPEDYWRAWSDPVISRIHSRVLEHVKRLAEAEQTEAEQTARR